MVFFFHEIPTGEIVLEDFVSDKFSRLDSSSRISGQFSDSISCVT